MPWLVWFVWIADGGYRDGFGDGDNVRDKFKVAIGHTLERWRVCLEVGFLQSSDNEKDRGGLSRRCEADAGACDVYGVSLECVEAATCQAKDTEGKEDRGEKTNLLSTWLAAAAKSGKEDPEAC